MPWFSKKPTPTRGVGDFDTSDLREGNPPSTWPRKSPPRDAITDVNVTEVSTRHSRITGGQVETLRADIQNGYSVTVKRYDGNNDALQVFIDHPGKHISIMETVSQAQLNKFINKNTR